MTVPLPASPHTDSERAAARCPAVQFSDWGITRCTKPAGHPLNVWHSGSGRYIDEDGEPDVYGTAWRELPSLVAAALTDGTPR